MQVVAKSGLANGNHVCTSFVLNSGDVTFMVTAPHGTTTAQDDARCPFPGYSRDAAFDFVKKHGVAVRAVGLAVGDAATAHQVATANGGVSTLEPQEVSEKVSGYKAVLSEVKAYGDVVLRFVSGTCHEHRLPGFVAVQPEGPTFGLQQLDHCAGNVPNLWEVADHLKAITGMHEFAEYTAADVGSVDSGLNSMMLANNSDYVLLPVSEPTFGTRRKSQIQTYLEFNQGPGVQHLALRTDDIFRTLRLMKAQSTSGGMEFMPRASEEYYRELPGKIGDALTAEQLKEAEELGVLADKDSEGVLLQIFTKPLGDRPTIFFEIIQRVGCLRKDSVPSDDAGVREVGTQAAGCGGFGKGNIKELFKSVERYEEELCV